ncbi:hypothetical protein [Rhizobium sp. CNPSo 3490]|uniref:hypothetical protein n=1 Tax=Rhizobium sp. CNPSo 3490 TaxID=3021407 RepID=UPI00254B77AC|nr:hypothetical protein [Rhizobium sp. CNPSo 3490]MDK4735604.1 hypothetical protein [Rhizobium sp. CNPSo 3490]
MKLKSASGISVTAVSASHSQGSGKHPKRSKVGGLIQRREYAGRAAISARLSSRSCRKSIFQDGLPIGWGILRDFKMVFYEGGGARPASPVMHIS